jgi:hypothetical protein
MKNSILFVRPDYHCSFTYRDELRKLGWKADIYLNPDYPADILYSKEDILKAPQLNFCKNLYFSWINHILVIFWWATNFWRYKYHLYYWRPPAFFFLDNRLGLTKLFGKDFLFELWLAKLFKIKLIYLPAGCHDEELKSIYSKIDNGNLCNNCGIYDRCDDKKNNLNFKRIRRYFNVVIGLGSINTTQFNTSKIKYKVINLELWNPGIVVPMNYVLPKTNNIRILHSSYLEKSNRNWNNKNSKGSPYILAAIQKLKDEGYPVEYYYINNKPPDQMRFYQVQADIVVEQLLAGLWGSTGVETMALGKPVVCYLRKSWKDYFFESYPEYDSLPIIEANIENIYDVLKKLVSDETYRYEKGKESREFAKNHFDPTKNAIGLINLLNSL